MSDNAVLIETNGRTAVITINRADTLNALDVSTCRDLDEAVTQVESDPNVNVVIFTGAGRAFVAGGDIADLNSRRGRVGQTEARGQNQVVIAQVPLSEMFGDATDLRSRTQGRATYTMQFDSYQQTPASVQEEIVARIRGE